MGRKAPRSLGARGRGQRAAVQRAKALSGGRAVQGEGGRLRAVRRGGGGELDRMDEQELSEGGGGRAFQ